MLERPDLLVQRSSGFMSDQMCTLEDGRRNKEHLDQDLNSELVAATRCLTAGYFL